jgi:hypothetical protein
MRARLLFICGVALIQAESAAAQVAQGAPAEQPVADRAVATPATATDEGRSNKKPNNAKPRVKREAVNAELSHSKSRLSEKPVPLLKEHTQLPERNPPIYEWNLPFLGPGNIISGFKSPTGAVWQPAFWVFGDLQSSAGVFNDGVHTGREYASARVDIFGNLQLTPTERVVIGFTPLSQGPNLGSGLLHVDGQGTQFVDAFNANPQVFFFEGDTRQLFPGIDSNDRNGLDFGFAVGKQWIFFQEGIMINDNIQALGITKDTIQIPGFTQDMRITGLYGWADIRRGDAMPAPDHSAQLLGIFTETDFRKNIVTFDVAYVASNNPGWPSYPFLLNGASGFNWDACGNPSFPCYPFQQRGGSGFYWGASSTQRFGEINTAFRINTSTALDGTGTAINNGVLLLAEISRTMPGSTNIIYANFFAALGDYTSAARSPQVGGPLERVGILFTPLAAGLAGSPIPGEANHAVGGTIGYQMFFSPRQQLTLELGVKDLTNGNIPGVRESEIALGAQYVQAVTSRTSIQVNGFVLETQNGAFGFGAAVGTKTRW